MNKTEEKPINLHSIRYKNSMKPIDWAYYTKFYPEKTKAIQALRLDTGLGLAEAKKVVEEIFARLEQGEVEQRKPNPEYVPRKERPVFSEYQQTYKSANASPKKKTKAKKVIGLGCLSVAYIFAGTIFKLTEEYSGKKRK